MSGVGAVAASALVLAACGPNEATLAPTLYPRPTHRASGDARRNPGAPGNPGTISHRCRGDCRRAWGQPDLL